MNKVILIGRLTKDIELRYTQMGTPVANFILAVNRPLAKENEQQADFISIEVWGKQAENLSKYQSKGSLIAVEGRIQTGSYEENGKRTYTTKVVASRIQYLQNKKDDTTVNQVSNNDVTSFKMDDIEQIPQEDLPFDNELPW